MECPHPPPSPPPPLTHTSNFHKSRVWWLLFTVVDTVLAEPISPRALILPVSGDTRTFPCKLPCVQSARGRSLLQLEPAGQ